MNVTGKNKRNTIRIDWIIEKSVVDVCTFASIIEVGKDMDFILISLDIPGRSCRHARSQD
jgi:hypothetical protein